MSRDVDHEPVPIESIADLVSHISAGAKDAAERKLGLEHEKFGVIQNETKTLTPLPYAGDVSVESVLDALADELGWEADKEGPHTVGVVGPGAGITLEPAGQLELSGAPFASLHDVHDELHHHLDAVKTVSQRLGVRWLAMGAHPTATLDDLPWVPKPRYRIMRAYLPSRGSMAHEMMKATCTVQANFDFTSEADAKELLNVAHRVSPTISAIFASSGLKEGAPADFTSRRCHFWTDMDNDRSGFLDFMLDGTFSFERYVAWALDVPMFFIRRDGKYIDSTHLTFRDYLRDGINGHRAVMGDWIHHLSTLFPEVRLKQYIEVRGADCVPPALMMSFAALWKGLLYSPTARERILERCGAWSREDLVACHLDGIKEGLTASLPDGTSMVSFARELHGWAASGLDELGVGSEADYLDALSKEILEPGASLSTQSRQRLIEADANARLSPAWFADSILKPFWVAS